ncbi:MAG: ammonia-forming cytochrome c nitrite reductase subunit c552 [Gemmataceae bacterium]|nr:ammonia-forming cytochrome c nitrite reductase subunit c552 [Gemmataceae bacterium]
MNLEALLFNVLICVALVPVVAALGRVKVSTRTAVGAIVTLWLGFAIIIVSTQFFLAKPPVNGEAKVTNRPIHLPTGNYVGSAACQSCHPHNHATWYDSYHRTMTQVASAKSVLGNFNNVRLFGKDLDVRLFKEGEQFLAEINLSNPRFTSTYPVVMTTGSHNRQAYWLAAGETPNDLMILPYMFLKDEQKWIPRHSAYINAMCLQERPELAVLRADRGRWAQVCIKCHATHGRPLAGGDELDNLARGGGATQAVEFGISCEACHGPGAEHVRVNRNPIRRYQQRLGAEPDLTIVNPARLPHDRSSEVCGQCHSVIEHRTTEAQKQWVYNGYSYRPGDDLALDPIRFIMRGRLELMPPDRPKDIPNPAETGSFWSDGMIRASGREYNGLIESPCFQRGKLSCLSCHEMHQARGDSRKRHEWADDQLKFGMDGNRACVQCHEGFRNADQLAKHTHHGADSAGSNCYNCHMPFTTYGILKAIRSHQIDSPSVKASQETGRPNACNQCHLDKTLAWTADRLERWYKIPAPKLSKDEQEVAGSVLWALRGDAGQRALMAWSYGWEDGLKAAGNHWQAPYLAQLLEDRYDAVRFIAHRSLRRLPGFHDFEHDFNAPPDVRAAAHQRALQVWSKSQQAGKLPFTRPVLIDTKGRVLETEFQRLWKHRDDRPMAINE